MITPDPVDIFWTGGWDSTYRVLDLVLRHRRAVRPLYVIDPGRLSTAHELRAIENITASVRARDPAAGALIHPLEVVTREPSSGPDDPWDAAHRTLLASLKLGPQYAFLARTLARMERTHVELCIEFLSKPQVALAPEVMLARPSGLPVHMLADSLPKDAPLRVLFERFTFPLFLMEKQEMGALARAAGFYDLMELTWFCHEPLPGNRPCGCCTPCSIAIKDGLLWRIPAASRRRRLWHCHVRRHWPRFYRWIGRRLA